MYFCIKGKHKKHKSGRCTCVLPDNDTSPSPLHSYPWGYSYMKEFENGGLRERPFTENGGLSERPVTEKRGGYWN